MKHDQMVNIKQLYDLSYQIALGYSFYILFIELNSIKLGWQKLDNGGRQQTAFYDLLFWKVNEWISYDELFLPKKTVRISLSSSL